MSGSCKVSMALLIALIGVGLSIILIVGLLSGLVARPNSKLDFETFEINIFTTKIILSQCRSMGVKSGS
jgi:hypothetical protein